MYWHSFAPRDEGQYAMQLLGGLSSAYWPQTEMISLVLFAGAGSGGQPGCHDWLGLMLTELTRLH